MKTRIATLILISLCASISAQNKIDPKTIDAKMQWFADAKLGIFIHWGIYSVNGIDESWSFYNKKVSYPEYMKQLTGFTAKNYNPEAWASLIRQSGARYAVITTKHHDGVALWNTKASDLNVVKMTPAKKDLITPFVKALRNNNLKVGTYFSLLDWSDKNYPGFLKDSSKYELKKNPTKWNAFVAFNQQQIKELSDQFNPDLFWFDGDWEHSADEWQAEKIRHDILAANPNAIINGRLQGYGDYETPEQNFPVTRPRYNWWELCMTMNNNWGYHPDDTNYKTPFEVISIFADCISMGGNLLLDIGPKEDGTIPPEQELILKELGQWTYKHSEAIFKTIPGLPQGHFYGPTTLSKDSSNLYLYVSGKTAGKLMIKGLKNKIEEITVVGGDQKLTHRVVGKISWSEVPGLVFIDFPLSAADPYMSVVKVKLSGPLKLYRGKGGFN
ncbi:MAG: alpha-L-fucosidase [Bacteroidetes bacterium]|nr:alpha-L-fucosidase [Bacteroidota bacterium]